MTDSAAADVPTSPFAATNDTTDRKDYRVRKDGLVYAGTHLLIDLCDARHLDDLELAERTVREAVTAIGATLLDLNVHHFSPNGGVSAVAVLAESHMSVHTWPEMNYAAVDIFVCGECDPYRAVPVLKRAWAPASVQLTEHRRGLVAP